MPGLMKFTFEGNEIELTLTEFIDDGIIANPGPGTSGGIFGFSYLNIPGASINLANYCTDFYNTAVMSGTSQTGARQPFTTFTYKDYSDNVLTATVEYQLQYDPLHPQGLFMEIYQNNISGPSIGHAWIEMEDPTWPCNYLNAFIITTKQYQNDTQYMQAFGYTMGGRIANIGGSERGGWFVSPKGTPPGDQGQTVEYRKFDYTNYNLAHYAHVDSSIWSGKYNRNCTFDGAYGYCINRIAYPPKQGDDDLDVTPYPDDMSEFTLPSSDQPYSKDESEEAPIESLPSVSMTDCGFIKAYVIGKTALNDLATFMLSDTFLNSVKKLFANPIDYIISLHMLPVTPTYGTSTPIYIGGVNTTVSGYPITDSYMDFDMGTINCDEMFHSFLDYSPTTKVSIFLPFLGIQQLNTEDVMTGTLHLTYHINVISGECLAQLSVTNNHMLKNAVIGEWGGTIIQTIPITARDQDAKIGGLIQAGASIGIAAAIGSPAAGIGALASSVGTVLTKPNVSRSGNVSGSVGILGKYQPFIIKERPVTAIPSTFKQLNGMGSCIGGKIKNFDGYLEVDSVDLTGVACTDAERDEILQLLEEGVFV